MTPLTGITVLDLGRNAPTPFASMLLADLGADVIAISGGGGDLAVPQFSRGKENITLDLKTESGRRAFHALAASADVVIEGFRPGVADRLGAGYAELRELNPRIVHCALTGYGQTGPLAQVASHDINYLALAGVLGVMGPADGPPVPPLNLVADIGGGALYAVVGILAALHERDRTGVGVSVDAAMLDGVVSMMSVFYGMWGTPMVPERGGGLFGGGAPFYRCYVCADGRFVAVGAVERQFFVNLWRELGLPGGPPDHRDRRNWPQLTATLEPVFAARTRDQWGEALLYQDCCVTPVLAPDEVWDLDQVVARHPHAGPDAIPVAPVMGAVEVPAPVERADTTRDLLTRFAVPQQIVDDVCAHNGSVRSAVPGWAPVHD